jgi:hypothetical protein
LEAKEAAVAHIDVPFGMNCYTLDAKEAIAKDTDMEPSVATYILGVRIASGKAAAIIKGVFGFDHL